MLVGPPILTNTFANFLPAEKASSSLSYCARLPGRHDRASSFTGGGQRVKSRLERPKMPRWARILTKAGTIFTPQKCQFDFHSFIYFMLTKEFVTSLQNGSDRVK